MNLPGMMIPIGSAPVPMSARSVLIFGGTFDPPHMGHLMLPGAARDALGFEWLMYVPAARSPHKEDGPRAGDEDRLAMLAAGLAEVTEAARGRTAIGTMELERAAADPDAPSYTIDTLRNLRRALPEAQLRLLIGADQAASFHAWREPREIIRVAEPVVMLRKPAETVVGLIEAMRATGGWTPAELEAWRGRVVDVPLIDADATGIRAALLRDGATNQMVHRCVPQSVRCLIEERRLYREM